jgi:hypothetical protein
MYLIRDWYPNYTRKHSYNSAIVEGGSSTLNKNWGKYMNSLVTNKVRQMAYNHMKRCYALFTLGN